MVDYFRMLALLGYSKEAFDIGEHFEFLETPSGVLCSEEMCPDNSIPSLRIAWLVALQSYGQIESEFDYFKMKEFYEELQSAI